MFGTFKKLALNTEVYALLAANGLRAADQRTIVDFSLRHKILPTVSSVPGATKRGKAIAVIYLSAFMMHAAEPNHTSLSFGSMMHAAMGDHLKVASIEEREALAAPLALFLGPMLDPEVSMSLDQLRIHVLESFA
ncbi:hypothetical protein EKG38_03385 [Shewanella canadensis]|uniref:Uncharacterized protein n=1 Tax=Shewanella canadensis TaxID=271096 RepID=A0A3S0KDM3_9GAMM|nr:hypothetical protein [Shewanella canadensis]RTR40966.1 hypothetical protein EKG38_03385 [Shewanella canadensis]